MKCRIWYRPTIWMAFDASNPAPWRLEVPAGLKYGREQRVDSSDHQDWESAILRLQALLGAQRRGYLHR